MRPGDTNPSEMGRFMLIGQVGFEMVALVGLGMAVDHFAGSRPWGTIVGVVAGLTGGITHLVLMANRQNREDDARRQPGGGTPGSNPATGPDRPDE